MVAVSALHGVNPNLKKNGLHFLPLNLDLYNHVFSDKLQICFVNGLD